MLYDTFMRTKLRNLPHKAPDIAKMTWNDIQTIVRSGTAAEYFTIGDQLTVERLSDVTANTDNNVGATFA